LFLFSYVIKSHVTLILEKNKISETLRKYYCAVSQKTNLVNFQDNRRPRVKKK